MTLKEIKDQAKKTNFVDTGYYRYIGYEEHWKHAISSGIKMREYVSDLGRVYDPLRGCLVKLHASMSKKNTNKQNYRISSITFHPLNPGIGPKYFLLILSRVVLETFKGPPPRDMKNPEADHIISNTLDNSAENLQWLSNRDNTRKSNAKHDITKILAAADLLDENQLSITKIAEIVGLPPSSVYDIKEKAVWSDYLEGYDFSGYNVFGGSYDLEMSRKIRKLVSEGKSNKEILKAINQPYSEKIIQQISAHRKRQGKQIIKQHKYPEGFMKKLDDAIRARKTNDEIYEMIGERNHRLQSLIALHRRKVGILTTDL